MNAPRPNPAAGSAAFETELVRWLRGRLAESRTAAQRAAANHHTNSYARHDAAADAFAEVLAVVDPLGGGQ